jgi:uncharacterized membrane protein YvlD (DUF360 family)
MSIENSPAPQPTPKFPRAFKQMASFVAIAKTRATSQVLDELILQCFVVLPSDPLSTPEQVSEAMLTLFGIQTNLKDVSMALARLTKAGTLNGVGNGHLSLAPAVMAELTARIETAKALERDVREMWLKQVQANAPALEGDKLWATLLAYLQQAFRRHGVQAVELLNPEVEIANESKASLSAVLDRIIGMTFPEKERAIARQAVSSFFLTVALDRKRAEYVASLADAAFNYFSLAVAPEVSEKLRGKLNSLTLFLDTNFLFGILNLHVNSQVDVSSELIDAIKRFKFPFRLRYHEATVREMSNTLFYFGKELNKQKWPQKISRAIVTSGALSGVELRYHAKNAEQPVSVDDFLAPLQHWQILLKDKGIDVYNTDSSQARLLARANLEAEYNDYLKSVHREKPPEAVQHDMTVLETVQSLRTNAKTTLDAGSLLVTCDYQLFRFDFEHSRKDDRHHSTVLPSLLWQILRPFVADNDEFDKAFAETFALPEFSLGRGGAQRAAARMASILASYSDIPEETASKMLANDLLIAELQSKRTDAEFAHTIESAVSAENAQLVEERAALAAQLESEKAGREAKQRELDAAAEQLRAREQSLEQKDQDLRAKEEAIQSLQAENASQVQMAEEAAKRVIAEHQEKEGAKRQAEALAKEVADAARREARTAKFASIFIAVLVIGIFELIIRAVVPWRWLLDHPNGYGLEGCFILILACGIIGFGVKVWRKGLWITGLVGAVLVALQIMGGKSPTP